MTIYNSTVKSVLMFNSIIWNPINLNWGKKLEIVQYKFLRFISFKIGQPLHPFDHNYEPILKLLNLKTLKDSRNIHDLNFIHKLENEHINCLYLKKKLNYYSSYNPIRTVKKIFDISFITKESSSLDRMKYLVNLNAQWIKLKNLTANEFSTQISKNNKKLNSIYLLK